MPRFKSTPGPAGAPGRPDPPPRDQVEADFDVLARRYDATLGRAKFPRLVSLVFSWRPPRKVRFLDIGCGGGHLVGRMAESFAEVWGIDISLGMLRVASQRTRHLANVRLARMDGQTLGLVDGTFYYIVCSYVLHHLDSAAALREAVRVLRSKGRLLVVDHIVPTDASGRREQPRRWFDPRRWPREMVLFLSLVRRYGVEDAVRVFWFLKSKAWRRHVAREWAPTPAEFAEVLKAELPGCLIGGDLQWEAYAVWDKPASMPSANERDDAPGPRERSRPVER